MKFGGTSVGDASAIDRVSKIVHARLVKQPVVVVSAMARVTDTLQTMGNAAVSGDLDSALELSQKLRDRHHATATELMPPAQYEQLCPQLDEAFVQLSDLLRGIAGVHELSPRTTDFLLSFGERLSSMVVTGAMAARGLSSVLVDSRECIVTDAQHTHAVPLFDETDPKLVARLKPLLDAGQVPVMAGFVGATQEGITTTIGRGGSDFSAAIVGAALDAECIEIWTDVDGVKTTDPKLCPDARLLDVVSFDEAAEMAFFGAKVLHPATMLPAMRKNIPVYVLNSMNPRCKGTCVRARSDRPKTRFNAFTAIAARKNITIVTVSASRMLMAHGFLHDVFERFKRYQISVDIVSTSEVSVSLTVDSKIDLTKVLADLSEFTDVHTEPGMAIIAVIGDNLRGTPGMCARVFGAISDINVRMISQGASEINISFVIEEKNVPETVQRLHKLLFPRQRHATEVQGDSEDEPAVAPLAQGAEGAAAARANAD
jgi:aspartate kinase